MKKLSKIVSHSAFQCITLTLGGLFILTGVLSLIFEYILSHEIPDYILSMLIPLPVIGLIIMLFSAILSAICRRYERKAKVRKTEECEGDMNSAPYNYDMSSSCVYGNSSWSIKNQSSSSGTCTVPLDKDARLVPSVANDRYFIEYKGVKIAEINHNGELITILVPDLYEEYKNE